MVSHYRSERSEHTSVKKRMEVVFLLFIALIFVIAGRLTYLQWLQSPAFADLANRMQGRILEIDAQRGRIQDRNGAELATDILGKAVSINPRLVKDPDATASRLAVLLGLGPKDREAIRDKIVRSKRKFYAQLRRGVERRLAERVLTVSKTEPELRSLWLEDSPVRVNPCGRDALQLIGAVSSDGQGIEGIEMRFEPVLGGRNGRRSVRVDGTGAPIPESDTTLEEPQDGKNVRLTIDRDIQHFVETELDQVAQAQVPDAATAMVMEVHSGDILAMASYPSPKPNARVFTPAERRNRAITDLFEPGSTFKVITAAAALEYGVSTNCYCSGSRTIGKRTVRCAHGRAHGAVDLHRMIEQSCNLAAGAISERVGREHMYTFLDRLGFQAKTGVEFPGEEYATMQQPDDWATMRTVNIGFGQGIQVTPIQLLAGYVAIANDGVYVPPRLVLDAPGIVLPERRPRRVMSAANSRILRSHMEAVVESGTGKAAKIPGYSVAGKTGTAQIAKYGRYGHGYVASFVGFLPALKPRLAVLVSVWHPRRGQYGGVVSAPVFREIARQSVAYLGIPPDAPRDLRDGSDPGSFYRYARAAGKHTAVDD